MREIHRIIVSALIFSKDNKLLMGRKDPLAGGVYANCWHIPGGGIDDGESFEEALIREVKEEVGIDISLYPIEPLFPIGSGSSEKKLKNSGETVLCHMEFHRFKVFLHDQLSEDIVLSLNDDLVETQWFDLDELASVQQIPGGKDFFQEIGLIPKS